MIPIQKPLDDLMSSYFVDRPWDSEGKMFSAIVDVFAISEGLMTPTSFSAGSLSRQAFEICRKTEAKAAQIAIISSLLSNVMNGGGPNLKSGRFSRGAAEVLLTAIHSQLKLVLENVSIIRLDGKKPQPVSLSTNEEILAAIRSRGWCVLFSQPNLWEYPQYALAALSTNIIAAMFFTDSQLRSPDFVHAAVQTNGLMLYFLDDRWRSNIKLVFESVHQNGRAIQFALSGARKHLCVVKEAVRQDSTASQFIEPALLCDLDVRISLVASFLVQEGLLPPSTTTESPQAQPQEQLPGSANEGTR